LTLPARPIDRDRVLWGRLEALQMGQDAHPRRHDLSKLFTCDDGNNSGRSFSRRGINSKNSRMGIWRAHKGDVNHARQAQVADELAATFRKAPQVRPGDAAANVGIRPVENGQAWACNFVHDTSPPLA